MNDLLKIGGSVITGATLVFSGVFIGKDEKPIEHELERPVYTQEQIFDTNPKLLEQIGDDANIPEFLRQMGSLSTIDGGVQFSPTIGVPPCQEQTRGMLWFAFSAEGEKDAVVACVRNEIGEFQWVEL